MDQSNVMYLITETSTQDEIGQYVSVEAKRMVYCDVRWAARAEWFEAGRNGFQPSFVFVMFQHDYQGEKILEYNGQRYGIYRTYVASNERIELYTEAKGGIHGQTEETSDNS